jgi:hypothetical protein
MTKASAQFIFYTRLNLTELTGLRARNINELLNYIKDAPDSCIYYHTHHFLQKHLFLIPEPPNDFAYWVKEILGKSELGEQLSSIDITEFSSIGNLRDNIIKIISDYIKQHPADLNQSVSKENEFYFMKSISFIFPSNYTADGAINFLEILKKISIDSIYFHMFEARLRLGHNKNDFSHWFESSLDDKRTADALTKIDPYTYTLEALRETIIHIIKENHYAKS